MKFIAMISVFLFSMSAFAGNSLDCFNTATGARFTIRSEGASLSRFSMNEALANALLHQGSRFAIRSGSGYSGGQPSQFYFAAGELRGYSVKFVSDSGGMKLNYQVYLDAVVAEFYFNPGECRFSAE